MKYNFPLMVLGFTHNAREFEPICFMYTSHEQQLDYDHFWRSLKDVCLANDIALDPK